MAEAKITIIYPYRNREESRIRKSLNSLSLQRNTSFKVLFIDYGSNIETAEKVKAIVLSYPFCEYIYSYHLYQPWSRAKAINIGLNAVRTPFCFIADIDMIFSSKFVDVLERLSSAKLVTYFKVGFLSEDESKQTKPFKEYKVAFESKEEASGLSLFPVDKLHEVGGFDEFFKYWGAEDNDIHERLSRIGVDNVFYDSELLMLHQWHLTHRSKNESKLTKDLWINGVSRINQKHLQNNSALNIIKVNSKGYGQLITKKEYEELLIPDVKLYRTTYKHCIDYLLKELYFYSNKVVQITIEPKAENLKYILKKYLKKKEALSAYSLKEVNDILLKEMLIHYQYNVYALKITDNLDKIILSIKL